MTSVLTAVILGVLILQPSGPGTIAAQDPKPGPMVSGRVLHADLPLPGATVAITRNGRTVSAMTDEDGAFQFVALDAGAWTLKVEMRGFAPVSREITIPPTEPVLTIALTMRSYVEIVGENAIKSVWPATPSIAVATDGAEILNGTITNGAATRFAQPRAAGNNRPRGPSLYSGSVTGNFGNSSWNARPYSFGGAAAAPPDYTDAQLGITIGGPLRIPFTRRWGPQARLSYQHGVQNTANTRSALVPTFDERRGDLSGRSGAIVDPHTGLPFVGNIIPADRIVPQATALLAFYPEPTGSIGTGANFQRAVLSSSTTDRLQVDVSHSFGPRTQVAGSVGYQRTLTDSVNLFGFEDRSRQSSISVSFSWNRRQSTRMNLRANYSFTLADSTATPFFANRVNVSGDAGIAGNAQDPLNWGPPTIAFPDFADLTDGRYQRSTRGSHTFSGQVQWRRGAHNITFGSDARLNAIRQDTHPDPRGTLTFTGAATGNAFADFLLGIPATSSIAFGNLSTAIRGNQLSAFFDDDLRISPGLTVALGVRWEYESPYSERDGRLANLEILPDFSAASIVTASEAGPRRDPFGFQPRIGISWRPLLTSSLVIKGGYGIYRNLGVYQSIGASLAQQPPFSSSFSAQNLSTGHGTGAPPLTLANPFPTSLPATTTFAVDPGFRTALVHSWQVTVQRDLPASLTVVAAYLGDRGVQLAQAFLPNTYAPGAVNPCPPCPTGFTYLTAGGTQLRNAAQLILRRRLYAGFTSTLTYTFAKSTDNAATFSNTNVSPTALSVAQDWRNLEAERGPSSFDQRNLMALEVQYTTGVGILGGTLVDNFWGRLYKDWTLTAQLNSGSGLPVTPLVFVAVPGTGTVGIRPALTGAPIAPQKKGAHANVAAFAVPSPGTWGDAGRNSIRGPSTFTFDMSVSRTFRFSRRFNLDWRLSASNVLNRVTFTTIDRIVTSPQFGRPTSAGQMRRILTNFIFRF